MHGLGPKHAASHHPPMKHAMGHIAHPKSKGTPKNLQTKHGNLRADDETVERRGQGFEGPSTSKDFKGIRFDGHGSTGKNTAVAQKDYRKLARRSMRFM